MVLIGRFPRRHKTRSCTTKHAGTPVRYFTPGVPKARRAVATTMRNCASKKGGVQILERSGVWCTQSGDNRRREGHSAHIQRFQAGKYIPQFKRIFSSLRKAMMIKHSCYNI